MKLMLDKLTKLDSIDDRVLRQGIGLKREMVLLRVWLGINLLYDLKLP